MISVILALAFERFDMHNKCDLGFGFYESFASFICVILMKC